MNKRPTTSKESIKLKRILDELLNLLLPIGDIVDSNILQLLLKWD